MEDKRRDIILRFAALFVVICIGFIAVIWKIIVIQHVEADHWLSYDKYKTCEKVIDAKRGDILDKDGNLLATSLPQYAIRMDTRVEALRQHNGQLFYQYVDSMAEGLSLVIGDKSASQYRQLMVQAYRNRKKYVKLYNGSINYLQKKQLQQVPLISQGAVKSGIFFEERHQRCKPFGSLSARTIGNTFGDGGHGRYGLEYSFDSYLVGQTGLATVRPVAGYQEPVVTQEAVPGYNIETTLDVSLMDICENALRKKVERWEADWGCCILMETETGKILALSNLDRTSEGNYIEGQNHAVWRVEPGSTFKTYALMAAIDDGKIDLYDTVSVTAATWYYGNAPHTDSHPKDTVYTVRSALAISSNIALAKIITRSYDGDASKFVNKLQKMGVCDSVYSEIPGFQNPLIRIPKDDAVTMSKMSYGYSVELTPLQIIMFYNGIANNGKMVRPYLVSRIMNGNKVVEEFETEVVKSSLCSKSTLEDIKLGLHDVVWDNDLPGTASIRKYDKVPKAQSQLVSIAGKTGTAQLREHGRYCKTKHRMTFVGYFPEENPKYTCLCMIEHPKFYPGYDAGMECGSAVREIAEKTMIYAGHYTIQNGKKIYDFK